MAVAENVTAALEVGEFKVGIENGTLALVMNDNGTMAMSASGGFEFEGRDMAVASADDAAIEYNDTGEVINETISIDGFPDVDLNLADGLRRIRVDGLELVVGGFFEVAGNFIFEKTTGTIRLSDNAWVDVDVDVLTLGGSDITAFAGSNGGQANAVGFNLTGVDFALAMFGEQGGTGRTWTTLCATASDAGFIGNDDIVFTFGNLTVELNLSSADEVVDYDNTDVTVDIGGGKSVTFAMSGEAGALIRAGGTATMSLSNFFHAQGSVMITKSDTRVVLSDSGEAVAVSMLEIGGTVASAFAGINGPGDSGSAMGFDLDTVTFGLAVFNPADGSDRSWFALKALVGSAEMAGVDALAGTSATDVKIEINQSSDGNSPVINFQHSFESVSGARDGSLAVETGDGSDPVAIEFTKRLIWLSGGFSIDIPDVVTASGTLSFKFSKAQVVLSDGASIQTGLIEVGGLGIDAVIGEPGNNVTIDNVNLGLALFTPDPESDDTDIDQRYWVALASDGGTVSVNNSGDLSGDVDDIQAGVNKGFGTLDDNPNTTVVDFKTGFESAPGVNDGTLVVDTGGEIEGIPVAFTLDFDGEILNFSAVVTIEIADFFHARGAFSFISGGPDQLVTLANDSADQVLVSIEILGVSGADVFAGVNGPYLTLDNSISDAAMGLFLSGVDFALVQLLEVGGQGREWYALRVVSGDASLVGITGIQVSLGDVIVEINGGTDTLDQELDDVVDFTASFGDGLLVDTGGVDGAGDPVEIEINYEAKVQRVQAAAYICVADFIYAGGTVDIQKDSLTLSVVDGSGTAENVDVEVLVLGGEEIAAFAGVNGPYINNDDGSLNNSAMGISLDEVSLAMAWMKVSAADGTGSDFRTWTAFRAEAGQASFVGVAGLGLEMTDFALAYNAGSGTDSGEANDTVVNFSAMAGGGLDVSTGTGQITLDFADEQMQAGGNLRLDVFGFFHIEGAFFLERASGTIRVTDGSSSDTVEVNQLVMGGQAASAFAGLNGPAGEAGEAGALGLSLVDVQFGLALFKPSDTADTRQWTALKAVAASASFTGMDGLTLDMSNLIVEVNQGSGDGNTTVVDFSAAPLQITTDAAGGDAMTLDFDGSFGALLRLSGSAQLDIFGFLTASGSFSFEKSSSSITVTDGVTPENVAVDQLVMGGTVVSAFAGINGGTSDALGFTLSDLSLGFALFTPPG